MEYVMLNVRGAFMDSVWEPKARKPGETPKCSMNAILDMSTEQGKKTFAEIQAVIVKVAKEKYGEKDYMTELKTLKAKGDLCLRSGDEKAKYEGFDGNYFLSASNDVRPLIVNGAGKAIDRASGQVYAGAIYNVKVDIWAQNHKDWGKRVNAKLLVIQKVSDAAAFGGSAPPTLDGMPMMEVGSGPSDASGGDGGDLFADDIPF